MTKAMMPGVERGGGSGVGGGKEGSCGQRKGTNSSNDFKNIVLLAAVKANELVDNHPDYAINAQDGG
jgi:hypothetical protein